MTRSRGSGSLRAALQWSSIVFWAQLALAREQGPSPVEDAVRDGHAPVPWRHDARCGPHYKVQWGDEEIPGECPASESVFDAHDPYPEKARWRSKAHCCHLSLGWCGGSAQHCDCKRDCVDYNKLGNIKWGDKAKAGIVAKSNDAPVVSAVVADDGDEVQREETECRSYMSEFGCSWSFQGHNCQDPAQNAGGPSPILGDRNLGYRCCCIYGLWAQGSPQVQKLEAELKTLRDHYKQKREDHEESWRVAPIGGWLMSALLCVYLAMHSTKAEREKRKTLGTRELPLVSFKDEDDML
eukprot:TRINITY_DN46752_c0_g1_i1.p1 TRINITY_DN46752_c0_g1~~TRINITY_DN46752_c0_g1_i1.p1  ORF type:complete len:296 (+),score=38.12 TRINITY_DN46752_c0_g1_i1:47-934(+)